MRKPRVNISNRVIRLYAGIAIALIATFQVYWLYSVYAEQKILVVKEAENILQARVLKKDLNPLAGTGAASGLSDNVSSKLADVLKSLKGEDIKVKISYEGDELLDNQATDALNQMMEKNDAAQMDIKPYYLDIKKEMNASYPGLEFSLLVEKGKNKLVFPQHKWKNTNNNSQKIVSQIDSGRTYQLYFRNLMEVILYKMFGSILLSLLYLLICVSAVIFLLKNIDKRRRLMEMKDNFTHNMTHEFKTPLATLYAATEALTTYNILDDKETAREYIGLMRNDLKRLSAMTESILNDAKLSKGKMVMDFQTVKLRDFVEGIVSDLKPQLAIKKAVVAYETIPDTIFVTVDKDHFTNVFTNLIDNSLKYSAEDARILIEAAEDGKFTTIRFSDNGIGIDLKYKNQIFSSYFRVPNGDQYKVKGYGLGLSYVKDVVALHGGTIELVDSKDNLGTTFEIILPV